MKHISEVQKHEAFIKYICGYSPQELANELNVHFTTVYRWISAWKRTLSRYKLADVSSQVKWAKFRHKVYQCRGEVSPGSIPAEKVSL